MTSSTDGYKSDGSLKAMDLDKDFDIFLQAQLQQEKRYIADDNFSVRVMASLPVAKQAISWRERLIVSLPLMVISVLVLSQNSLLAFAIKSWVLLSILSIDNLFKIVVAVSLAMLLSASCWFAKRYGIF